MTDFCFSQWTFGRSRTSSQRRRRGWRSCMIRGRRTDSSWWSSGQTSTPMRTTMRMMIWWKPSMVSPQRKQKIDKILYNKTYYEKCFNLTLQVWEQREHDDPVLHQGLQLRQAGGGEGWDRVRKAGGRKIRLQTAQIPNVWIHDQLYPQTQTSAGKIHDEQCPRKLHNSPGRNCVNI